MTTENIILYSFMFIFFKVRVNFHREQKLQNIGKLPLASTGGGQSDCQDIIVATGMKAPAHNSFSLNVRVEDMMKT